MKQLRIGIFGTGRGVDIAMNFLRLDCDVVAVCENRPERLEKAYKYLGRDIAVYEDFDKFLDHGLDAVVLANFFHEHAPYAIKCLERGIHVYSECISNGTMAEGVALVRAAEKSDAIYMLAENYPNMLFNREIKRVCEGGTLGKILYAEGEYNHPFNLMNTESFKNTFYFEEHWRNHGSSVYYLTHSLAPLMAATGASPKRVCAMAAYAPETRDVPNPSLNGDKAGVMLTMNDDDSLFRITGCTGYGAHGNSYRVCGTKGQIENLRGMGEQVMLHYNAWDVPEGGEETKLYTPDWNDKDEELIKASGHGGGDYITCRIFKECILEDEQPPVPYDVYSATTMASVAHLAHRSMLEGGVPYDIPDLRREEDRALYENDYLSTYADKDSPNYLRGCSRADHVPSEKQLQLYREALSSQ